MSKAYYLRFSLLSAKIPVRQGEKHKGRDHFNLQHQLIDYQMHTQPGLSRANRPSESN